jgi:hypothetical protein
LLSRAIVDHEIQAAGSHQPTDVNNRKASAQPLTLS